MKIKATVVFSVDKSTTVLSAVDEVVSIQLIHQTLKDPTGAERKARWRALKRKTIEARVDERLARGDRVMLRKGKWWRSTGEEVLRAIFADGKSHHTQELYPLFEKEGYSKSSMSPRLVDLVRKGVIEKVMEGTYRLTNVSEG